MTQPQQKEQPKKRLRISQPERLPLALDAAAAAFLQAAIDAGELEGDY
jgi:hypothetical protein